MSDTVRRLAYFEAFVHPIAEQVLGDAGGVALTRLERGADAAAIARALEAAHGFQLMAKTEHPVDWLPLAPVLDGCPNLLAVSSLGAGYDMVDVAACTERGIMVVNNSGANSDSVAQHAAGMMLVLSKNMIGLDRLVRRRAGIDRFADGLLGRELTGKTLGIVGLGNIGRRLARIAAVALGMRVIAYDPHLEPADFAERGAEPVDFQTLFGEADVVSLHCPLTDETRGMVDGAAFGLMKPGSLFVTTARGFIHDEAALAAALAEGRLAGAGIDVFDEEPPGPGHPLMAFDNVLLTPHVAGVTDVANREMARQAALQWLDIMAGRRPPRLVNPEVWPAYRERHRRITGSPVLD